ncbi:biotin--[acetyl-CoA-carboxylase] ligase [Paracoccus siganidrum]|uniref:biotin--[biotin carboxyl-carrier protein] ligase n=1 Tax=Paracoccus siganidrum TaxID=1276757 RepID=A0A419A6Y9_9RHOB|nr:biotin--[acetyl-CoA-carboxylase] ligase [Paracoccus siganidrum]RJL14508.1 biotin--[acetyl-CoA-carboxylase] ligase [Paracoccus siganidrum]RMC33968.1 biotin--[acetyl-CoA-carboxylase] ligase [Paracoccus siganidrum]
MTEPARDSWPEDVARHVLDRVDSTNAEALRLAPSLSGPAWILARRQQAGRGRRGRSWSDPPGNFAATLVLRPEGGPGDAARLSFVAALALHDALGRLIGPHGRLALKWPNDVLLNGGKLSGILLESAGAGPQVAALAIGIGVNLAAAPEDGAIEPGAVRPVSLKGETRLEVAPEELLDVLAPAFEHWWRQLRSYGFQPIRRAWLARAARLGETIVARTGETRTEGRFEGIDDSGALMLTTARGRVLIPAADIYFREG